MLIHQVRWAEWDCENDSWSMALTNVWLPLASHLSGWKQTEIRLEAVCDFFVRLCLIETEKTFSAGPHTSWPPACKLIHTSCHIHQSVSRDNRMDRFAQRLLDPSLSSNPSSNQWSFLDAFIITELPEVLNRMWAVGQRRGREIRELNPSSETAKNSKDRFCWYSR